MTPEQPMVESPIEDQLTDLMFKALASSTRREILTLLVTGVADDAACCTTEAVCACDLADGLGLGAPTVSHHMKILIEAQLVASEKRGQWVHYSLRPEGIRRLMDSLGALCGCS